MTINDYQKVNKRYSVIINILFDAFIRANIDKTAGYGSSNMAFRLLKEYRLNMDDYYTTTVC